MKGTNGQLTCLQSWPGTDYWKGIVVDQTSSISPSSNWAVDLSNFTIEYAEGAIHCQTSGANEQTRMLKLNSVTFDKNQYHMWIYNYSTMGSVSSLNYSNIYINGCAIY